MSKSISTSKNWFLPDETSTIAVGTELAKAIKNDLNQGVIVFLNGELGAGKTTLTRGFIRGMGHEGNVKSPTYTLVEPYELPPWQVYHFDLYRLADPEELEFMGIREYFNRHSCCFIEWPEKAAGFISEPDLIIHLSYQGEQRHIDLQASSSIGAVLLALLDK